MKHMSSSSRRGFLSALAAITLAGCAAIETKKRSQVLTERVRSYTKSVRWGDFDIAQRFIKPRTGPEPAVDTEHLRGLRVTHYDYAINAPDPEAKEAEMTATFDYQQQGTVTVRRLKQTAIWWYSDEHETWYLDGALPDFK